MRNKFLKLGAAAITILAFSFGNAQTAPGTAVNIAKGANATPGSQNTTVRVIDNKGTIKYLQSNNGITTFTNTTANVTTTTFQLGGTLTDDTFIDVSGQVFGLNGIDITAVAASTDATTDSSAGTGTGYTLLVRNEGTGAIEKLLVGELIQSGHQVFPVVAPATAGGPLLFTYTVTTGDVPLPTFGTVYVYRNGAKLIAGLDYTIAGAIVTLVPSTVVNNDWTLYEGDVIEVHFVK